MTSVHHELIPLRVYGATSFDPMDGTWCSHDCKITPTDRQAAAPVC